MTSPLTGVRLVALPIGTLAAVLLTVGMAVGQGHPTDNPAFAGRTVQTPAEAVDRTNVVQTVDAVFTQFDAKDWAGLGSLFADRVRIDFSSLGGPRTTVTREELIDGWRDAFAGNKTSLHQTGNHQVRIDGDTAEVFLHGYAYNALARPYGDDVWETWGTYRFSLRRVARTDWEVTREQYVSLRSEGNEGVRDAVGG
jgi:SnoaL-like domain